MEIAIILPAYNEAVTIQEVVRTFHRACPQASVWVVDNNSGDGTGDLARQTLMEEGIRGGVLAERRQGKSFAIRKAFREVEADIYVMVDADLTYPASALPDMLAFFEDSGADMIVGDRLSKGDYQDSTKRRFHFFGNNLVRFLINVLFGGTLVDIMSGYRVMRRVLVKNFPSLHSGFELETELTIFSLERNFLVKEFPIDYASRPEGSTSKLSTFRDGFRVVRLIFFLFKNYRPLKFFGGLAVILFVAGLAVGLPVVLEFLATGLIDKVPSAILATGLMILSGHFLSLGIIMDTVANFHQQQYELTLNRYYDR